MEMSFREIWRIGKENLWRFRPILLFTTVGLIVYLIAFSSTDTSEQINILRSMEPVTKVEIKIGSDSPVTFVVLTDRRQLDSIGHAFRNAQEKKIAKGGAFAIGAEMRVFKGKREVDLFIQHSVYNGWMIEVGGATLTNEYLFDLIQRYAQAEEDKQSR